MKGAVACFKESGEIGNMDSISHREQIVIAESNANVRTQLRYVVATESFEQYSPNYDWIPCNYENISILSKTLIENAKLLGPKKASVVINSTGVREPSETSLTVGNIVEKRYLQETYRKKFGCENNCVWLAAAMVIKTEHEYEAERMIEEINKNPSEYEYLNLFNRRGYPNLAKKLIEMKSLYIVQKVKGCNRDNSFSFLTNNVKNGIYIGVLKCDGVGGERTHAVGLDLKNQRIFDSMEQRDMPFAIEYLHHCCGPNRKFHRFDLVCQLKLKYKKKIAKMDN